MAMEHGQPKAHHKHASPSAHTSVQDIVSDSSTLMASMDVSCDDEVVAEVVDVVSEIDAGDVGMIVAV